MKKINRCRIFLFVLLSFFTVTSFAWDLQNLIWSVSDPNDTRYHNSGFLLSGDIFSLHRTPWTFWSVTGSLGQWLSSAPMNKSLTTGAVSLALRLYPFDIAKTYPAYLLGSVGPAYLSSVRFGTNTQASHLAFQVNLGLGVELHKFDVNLRLNHYSNAGLGSPNQGYNILYVLSFGYLF